MVWFQLAHPVNAGCAVNCTNRITNSLACLKSKVSISNASEVFSNLHSLTQLLIDLQRNFCYLRQLESRSSEREASIKNYLTAHSSYLHKEVSVRDFSTCGFGLSALVPLTEGECVLRVPKSAMLTSEAPEKLQLMMKDDPIFASMDNVALSLRLLYELSNFHTSSWREYLSILPVTYSTFMYMSVDDFKHLKGSKTAETLASNYQFICRQYAYFFNRFRSFSPSKEIPLSARFCFEDYRWAVSTVMSRNNIIPVKESLSKQICLVPIWDMINHKPGAVSLAVILPCFLIYP
ncbi:unnamed protein product [Calicophoron daubneyi]|uniref:protein-histidine N-methyltransferase n=1 Tax=Calicophoron daubneyi TaxID=300641 RepID=A0AAV2TYG1_CALDB